MPTLTKTTLRDSNAESIRAFEDADGASIPATILVNESGELSDADSPALVEEVSLASVLGKILHELKAINIHLSMMTDNEIGPQDAE